MNIAPRLSALLLLGALHSISAAARADTAGELIEKGDAFDRRLQPAQALDFYLPAEKAAPGDAGLLVRIARQYRHLMSGTSSKKEKLRLGRISLDYAQRASAAAPRDAEAQLSPAISLGKMLPFMGSGDQVEAAPRIKAAVDRTLRLDPRNDYAWHILGRWNRNLAAVGGVKRALAGAIYGSLPVTTNEAAEACLKKAIAINPNRLIHYIEMGRVYAQMGRNEEARTFLEKGLRMPSRQIDDPEMKAIGRETLKKLK